ncbi:glycerate dehydrogenase [Methanocella paludicola SANAE]|uniref:Glycerate dehydrogenase n=1 Tax=Methanocella paludicola (strain DSM 17711 / JCM 13418 / NBRC 101707 / SANAE) TaxID=304371 RepID=D1YY17_METPS|nr:phosphoglycerate dehydrogenase [Methanocella paludicola]BAI61339.1 glycerate dehydrogenase [Methanocella paludicola SANAE]
MKIVISEPIYLTDEYRRRLEALGDLRAYDSVPTSDEDFVSRIKDAEIVIAGRYGFSGESIRRAPGLKMIALWQTGYDNVDLAAATARGVVVSNVHNYAFDTVAEFAFALALNLLRKVDKADLNLRRGLFDWRRYVGEELMGKTLGVIGLGSIGRRVVQIAHGFNMSVLSVTAHPDPERARALGVKFVSLDTLLAESDVVSLHVPLTPETEHMIGAAQLARMKPTAILINTARGKIVDEKALVEALREKRIAGAGLDVFETEPLPMDSPLLKLDNVVLTPHIAFLSKESIDECTRVTMENVEMFVKGRPQNVVNQAVLAKKAEEGLA